MRSPGALFCAYRRLLLLGLPDARSSTPVYNTGDATQENQTMKTCLACLLTALFASASFADERFVTVTPEETDAILANPGMGWETFHRTARQDKSLPNWIPSTVHYARWGWGELEPLPGKLNTEFLDQVLKETREAGQKLAFRVMC